MAYKSYESRPVAGETSPETPTDEASARLEAPTAFSAVGDEAADADVAEPTRIPTVTTAARRKRAGALRRVGGRARSWCLSCQANALQQWLLGRREDLILGCPPGVSWPSPGHWRSRPTV